MTDLTLSNTQRRILEEAANSAGSAIEEFTGNIPAGAQKRVMEALLRKGYIETQGNTHRITETGCNAVGRDATPCNTPKRETKQSIIIELLSRAEGATLPMLISATGWKSHSVRGHLSNLRKKRGLPIETFTNTDGTHGYRLPSAEESVA